MVTLRRYNVLLTIKIDIILLFAIHIGPLEPKHTILLFGKANTI